MVESSESPKASKESVEDHGEGLKSRRYKKQRRARLDHILRRIHDKGIDSLCRAELGYLERVAAELRFELGWSDSRPGYDER